MNAEPFAAKEQFNDTLEAQKTIISSTSIRQYDYIDALRGFAILGVVLFHTAQWVKPGSEVLNRMAGNGAHGVQLFFMVSALTLFLSMNSRIKQEPSALRNFFIRRFCRIAPLFFVAIIGYSIIQGFDPRHYAPYGIEWWYLPLTAFFLHGWTPETINSVVPGGWSIAVEFSFYVLAPYLYLRLKDIRSSLLFIFASLILSRLLAWTVIQTVSPLYPHDQQYLVETFRYFWFFSQAPIFGLGIFAYHIVKRYKNYRDRNSGALLLLLSVYLFASLFRTHSPGIPHHVFMGIIFFAFILSLYFFPVKILVNPVTIWTGKLSFSIYLTHFAIIDLMEFLSAGKMWLSGDIGFAAAFILVMLVSAGISCITYRMIELPGIRLGKQIIETSSRTSYLNYSSPQPCRADCTSPELMDTPKD